MNSQEYIKKKLENFVGQFIFTLCKYEWDEFSNTHLVDISYVEGYSESTDIKLAKRRLKKEFLKQYPLEGFLFIQENSLIEITSPDALFTGVLYKNEQFKWALFINVARANNRFADYTVDTQMLSADSGPLFAGYSGKDFEIQVTHV